MRRKRKRKKRERLRRKLHLPSFLRRDKKDSKTKKVKETNNTDEEFVSISDKIIKRTNFLTEEFPLKLNTL